MIPDSFIEELKYACDIEQTVASYVSLKRNGSRLTGLCPFHSEKTPSFVVYRDSQSYYCFGCGSGGDVITFIRNIEHLEYMEALRFLAGRAGMHLPEDAVNDNAARLKSRILEINRESARFFHESLISDAGREALSYLTGRGLAMKSIRTFGLGYSPDSWDALFNHLRGKGYMREEIAAAAVAKEGKNGGYYDMFRGRVMFPIIDLRGNIIGFGGRGMGENGPKYLNSPDTPVFKKSRNLFALNFAKAAKSDTLILGEGYMDVIAMHQAGFTNAVATLGTSLTEEQARLLSQYAKKVAIAYDSDTAGQNASARAINLFRETDVQVRVLEIMDAKDPDEYIRKFGSQRFANLVDGGKGAIHFEIDKLRKKHDIDSSEGAVAFLNDFCKLMANIDNDIERDVYIGEIARELDVGRDKLISTTQAIRKKRFMARQKKESHNLRVYAQDNAGKAMKPRSAELEGQVAEEKLIALLMKNPDYYDDVGDKITPEDFSAEENREIFLAIRENLARKQAPELFHLSSSLSPPLMAKLTGLMATSRDLMFSRQQADEYIRVMKAQKNKKTDDELRDMDPETLQKYLLEQKKMRK